MQQSYNQCTDCSQSSESWVCGQRVVNRFILYPSNQQTPWNCSQYLNGVGRVYFFLIKAVSFSAKVDPTANPIPSMIQTIHSPLNATHPIFIFLLLLQPRLESQYGTLLVHHIPSIWISCCPAHGQMRIECLNHLTDQQKLRLPVAPDGAWPLKSHRFIDVKIGSPSFFRHIHKEAPLELVQCFSLQFSSWVTS